MDTNRWAALIRAISEALNTPAGLMLTRSLARGLLVLLIAAAFALPTLVERWNGNLPGVAPPAVEQSGSTIILPSIK